ncbi:MAG: uracil-DNA glycosylase [Candidatus Lindowbacteria bacterium]|nr:uracil-DNA glycosylase [Candidatus Lindowbacteria bacterium]
MTPNPNQNLSALEKRITSCTLCPRLVEWREETARTKRRAYMDCDYWGKPVPGFGDPIAEVLVVGLAPGAHGSNRTGRQFTGDASGSFLFPALHRAGFSSQPEAYGRDDELKLQNMFISALCRCAPPDNKPSREEMMACRPFLEEELNQLSSSGLKVIVALGKIAFDEVVKIYKGRGRALEKVKFGHGAVLKLGQDPGWLIGSYHPSRQNTQTGRLTTPMFDQIWSLALEKIL